jgi:hypothetical protein
LQIALCSFCFLQLFREQNDIEHGRKCAEDYGTSVQGLHIRRLEHGNTEVIMVKKIVASYTELVEEMRKERY